MRYLPWKMLFHSISPLALQMLNGASNPAGPRARPLTIGILTKVFCTSGPNLVVLAWTGYELSCGQAQNGVNFDFEGKFDLEGKGESPLKTIGILTMVFYTYCSNLVILAWSDWHMDE